MKSFVLCLTALCACVGDSPVVSPQTDAAPNDKDASTDSSVAPDVSSDTSPVNTYLDPTMDVNWESVALNAPNGFSGGAALNGYVYFAPNAATVLRYDTKKPFTSVGSYDLVDISKFNPSPAVGSGYHGAVADSNGRIWFINAGLPGGKGAYVNAIDGKDITMSAAWNIVDFQGDSRMYGYFGGATDGSAMFWFPSVKNNCNNCSPYALFLLHIPLGNTNQYDNKNLLDENAAITASFGGSVVSGSVYTSPSGGIAMRHVAANFTGAFDQFAVSSLTPPLMNSKGAIFDGTYLYFPGVNVVARVEVAKDFTKATSWSSVGVNSTVAGGQFDGQRVIFAPDGAGAALVYDTTKPFTQASSWQTHNVKGSISGSAYDGQYVYFAPADPGTQMQRFKAHTLAMSPTMGGSTF